MVRRYLDTAYLAIVGTQLFGMLGQSPPSQSQLSHYHGIHRNKERKTLLTKSSTVLDLVPFYPKFLYASPSAPLHFLLSLRATYVSLTTDPFFAHDNHDPWFEAFLYIEALAQFPLAVYLVTKLAAAAAAAGKRKGTTSGRTELAALVFACLTAMGSVVCCYHLVQLGPEVVSEEKKAMLLYGEYLPFAVIRKSSSLFQSSPCENVFC
jgi:hypothetical protein